MKKIILIFSLSGLCLYGQSQSPSSASSEEYTFLKEVPVEAWQGKPFRYEIAVTSRYADPEAAVRFFSESCTGGNQPSRNKFRIETRQEQEWTIYTIVGTVGNNTGKIRFYAVVDGSGDFYFDDISLYIQDQPNHWHQLILSNPSFEEGRVGPVPGLSISSNLPAFARAQISTDVYKSGFQSLEIINRPRASASNVGVDME